MAWKKSNVTPVHKGGNTDDPGNYRPISVVPIVAKVFEKMIASQLNMFWSTTTCYIIFREPIGMGGWQTRF